MTDTVGNINYGCHFADIFRQKIKSNGYIFIAALALSGSIVAVMFNGTEQGEIIVIDKTALRIHIIQFAVFVKDDQR